MCVTSSILSWSYCFVLILDLNKLNKCSCQINVESKVAMVWDFQGVTTLSKNIAVLQYHGVWCYYYYKQLQWPLKEWKQNVFFGWRNALLWSELETILMKVSLPLKFSRISKLHKLETFKWGERNFKFVFGFTKPLYLNKDHKLVLFGCFTVCINKNKLCTCTTAWYLN